MENTGKLLVGAALVSFVDYRPLSDDHSNKVSNLCSKSKEWTKEDKNWHV